MPASLCERDRWGLRTLALESLLFIWGHIKYREIGPIMISVVLGLMMAFIAYGRAVLAPL